MNTPTTPAPTNQKESQKMTNTAPTQAQLIPIDDTSVSGKVVKTADARKLHAKLEIGKDFSSWIKAQLKRARLVEGKDYIKLTQKGELSTTGQASTEYHLTVRASEHIAMMSNTDKGHEVREYFIQVEEDHVNLRIAQATHQTEIAHTDLTRAVYFGKHHDATVAGLYYAAVEARVMGVEYSAEKYGLSVPFVQSLLRFKQEHLREWDPRTRDGSSFPSETPTAIGTNRTDLRLR